MEVPVLVAVPYANLDSWRNFAGDLAIEHNLDAMPAEGADLCSHLGLAQRMHDRAATESDGLVLQ